MSWQPISPDALLDEIDRGQRGMSAAERRFWEAIRIDPAKWKLDPWGRDGGGFWAVGVLGTSVLWYNDIESGFNRSRYTDHGRIDEYSCNQDELDVTVRHLLAQVDTGAHSGQRLGPPEPVTDHTHRAEHPRSPSLSEQSQQERRQRSSTGCAVLITLLACAFGLVLGALRSLFGESLPLWAIGIAAAIWFLLLLGLDRVRRRAVATGGPSRGGPTVAERRET